jgi:hypothetical protein
VSKGLLVLRDYRVFLERKVILVKWVVSVQLVPKEYRVTRVFKDNRAIKEYKVILVQLVLKESKDFREKEVL